MKTDMSTLFTETAKNDGSTRKDRIQKKLEENGYTIAYNELTANIEVNGKPIEDMLVSKMIMAMLEYGFTRTDIRDTINVIAYENSYHPIKAYFDTLPHTTSTETIDTFLACLDIRDKEITAVVFKKWLVGMVARVYQTHQNIVLVLEGTQGIGKTSLARWLSVNDTWFTDTDINPDDKDSVLALTQYLVWELGELERVTSKRDANVLKAFITKDNISLRPAYARYNVNRKALASFIGTVNSSNYLVDMTGNRRYYPIYVNSIDIAYQQIDKDALWSEIMALYTSGFDYTLSTEEKAYQTAINDEKMHYDAVYDYLQNILEPEENGFVSVVDIMNALRDNGFNVSSHTRKVKDSMIKLGYTDTRKGKARVRGFSGCKLTKGSILSLEEYALLYDN